jgi:UDP-N-acetylmuramoyl-tripeptide--D-alanyl-D-alanine ligase
MTLAQAHALLPAAVLVGDGNVAIERVHTDTRSLRPGDLFVALRGERFDAHDFLAAAHAAGAVAAIAERGLGTDMPNGLQVDDPLAALQQLAGAWRGRHALPLIAVTGSNGKTTVTQMIASILRAAYGDAALATVGNLNNHIGLPLTLLRLRQDDLLRHVAAVVELGMNHPGEIAQLAALAQPTVALVNNAQREHQEFMHSVEAVARENGSVIASLAADGTAVFPADEEYTPLWRELAGARRVLTFAVTFALDDAPTDGNGNSNAPAEVVGQSHWALDAAPDTACPVPASAAAFAGGRWWLKLHTPAGPACVALQVAGRHNLKNALAATAAALAAGVPLDAVVRGLASFAPVKGRSQVRSLQRHGNAVTLIDDSYNANPDSVLAAIDVLSELPASRWLLLGDMGEVGDEGARFHAEAGAKARAAGIHHFWCAGPLCVHAARAYGARARHFADAPALIAALGPALEGVPEFGAVLVKGSRFMGMERVVAALEAAAGGVHAA